MSGPLLPDVFRMAAAKRHAAAEPRDEPAQGLTFVSHYWELMRQSWRLLLGLALAVALVSGALATVKLNTSPVYRASAKVTVQPTDAELRFTQVYVRSSSYDSANVVTQSHMEYLQSHEIAARVHNRLTAGSEGALQVEPGILGRVKSRVKGTLRWLNTGSARPVSGAEAEIEEIREAIEVGMIESSFIMEIAVRWEDPETAARIANILAEVYQQRAREQSASSRGEIETVLTRQKEQIRAEIDRLIERRERMRDEFGVIDVATERSNLLNRISDETASLDAARADMRATTAMVQTFAAEETGMRRNGLNDTMEEQLALARVREVELRQSIDERQKVIANLRDQLTALANHEVPLEEIETEIARQRARLDDVESRLLDVAMAQTGSLEPLRIIDPARAPAVPEEPRVLNATATGAAAGLVLALMAIFLGDLRSRNLRTGVELEEIEGVRVLDPIRERGRSRRAPDEEFERPFLGWHAFDTDWPVAVLDVANPARAERVAEAMMGSYPWNDSVTAGLAAHVDRPGTLADETAVALVTLGRGEISAADLREMLAAVFEALPGRPVALAYVERS